MRALTVLLTIAMTACGPGAQDDGEVDSAQTPATETDSTSAGSTTTGASGADRARADSLGAPPDTMPAGAPRPAGADTGYKRPERRPIRDIPPLTRPDSARPPGPPAAG